MTRRGRGLLLLAGLAAAGCIVRPDEILLAPDAVAASPEVRIGLATSTTRVTLASDQGLLIVDPDEGDLAEVPAGTALDAVARGTAVVLDGAGQGITRRALRVEPLGTGMLSVDGRAVAGTVELTRSGEALRVVNHVPVEAYLVGVVSAEMGRRTPEELAALKAQAVAARTYTLRNLGRSADQGFDLAADVTAQVYGDVRLADELVREAVAATHGEVLEHDGILIDAFYSSTCGGHTEDGEAAFAGAARPYLRSFADTAPDGTAWCAISPRFAWREQWSATRLQAILRRTAAAEGAARAGGGTVRDLRIVERTATGRIAALEVAGSAGPAVVRGQAIRRLLAPEPGAWLRSTDFSIRIARTGGRIERVELEGRGYGHGVGMCQWGAIGRARAGHDYAEILMSYFPGTTLRRLY